MRAYGDAISPAQRPLIDRIDRLIHEVHPDVEPGMSYTMPTYRVGERGLHVAAWKGWVALYGWSHDRDGGFTARHPGLVGERGTIRIRPRDDVSDDDLRDLLRATLAP